jgi:outer membrane lipoprotein-sorting protein
MNLQSPPFDNELPDDVLERAIAAHQDEVVPPGPSGSLVATTLQTLEESERSRHSLPLPGTRMKRYLTAAAGLLLAIVVFATVGVLFRSQPAGAFARMIEPLLQAKTARFNITVELKDRPKQTIRAMTSGAGHVRQEMPTGQIFIIDANAGKWVTFNPADKSASAFNSTVEPAQPRPANYIDLLQTGLRSVENDPAVDRESLGEKQIAGHEAIGYRVKLNQPSGELTIWGDPSTGLPIVADMKLAMLPDCCITMTDFEFDVALDPTLFDTQVPNGYTLIEHAVSVPTEADLIAGLKLVAEHNGGVFPDAFDFSATGPLLADFAKNNSGKPDAAWKEEAVQRIQPFSKGWAFAAALPAESNALYAGKEVKLGDASATVFWYKPVGATAYRVLHGDLTMQEQQDAPESPHAVPVTLTFPAGKMVSDMMKRLRPPGLPAPAPSAEATIHESRPDDPAARQILDETINVYANCRSYRDTGVATSVFHKTSGAIHTTERPFATAFVRPDRFRFEFNHREQVIRDPLGDRLSRYIIWSNGKEVQTWWDIKPGIEKPESLSFAVGAAAGVSGVTSSTIPGLLMPKQIGAGKLTLIKYRGGFALDEEGQFDAHECYRIIGEWGKLPMTVWIDKQSYLVRRIDTQNPVRDLRVDETITYDPSIDVEVADELLEFDAPEQE